MNSYQLINFIIKRLNGFQLMKKILLLLLYTLNDNFEWLYYST